MKDVNLKEINTILSDTLRKVIDRDIAHKQAMLITKIASAISKNIVNVELKDRIELLEAALKFRK